MEKREKEFQEVLIKIEKYMRNKNFSNAIKYYHTLHNLFNNLSEELREKYQKESLTTYKELVLYITTNEAYSLAENHGELRALGNHLEQIYDLENDIKELPNSELLLKYIKPKFQFCLDIYEYRHAGKDFDDKFKRVEELITDGKTQAALKEYAHLLIAYNKFIRFEDEDKAKKVYNKILDLFHRIKTHKQIEEVYKRPKFKPQQISDNKIPYNPTRPYVTRPSVRIMTDNLKTFPQKIITKPQFKINTKSASAFNDLFKEQPKIRLNFNDLQEYPTYQTLDVTGISIEEPIDPFSKLKDHIRNDNVSEAAELLKRL